MIGNVLAGVRTLRWIAFSLSLLGGIPAIAASAADCPGHPDALGTSRTLVVDPHEHPRIGIMQYPETLPLRDHEVVLTFDDGPLPRNSNQILQILADQCIKATFFEIGRQAQANPEGIRKLAAAGHTIGTHTQDHPLNMKKLPIERARQEIDEGIASVKSALGDDSKLAPFFRIPGLSRAEATEEYLASQGIQTWSADFLADDWRRISSARVYELAIKRLDQYGKGILLLHDIQARTVAALPRILQEMKARGYRIVHVVPASPELPATPTEPPQWQMHPPSENVAISHWPKIPNFVFADVGLLPAPAISDLDWGVAQSMTSAEADRARLLAHGVPLPREAPWPRPSELAQDLLAPDAAGLMLPIPAETVFQIKEGLRAAMQDAAPNPRRAELTVPARDEAISNEAGHSRRTIRGRAVSRHSRQAAAPGTRHAAHVGRGALKRVVQVKRRSV